MARWAGLTACAALLVFAAAATGTGFVPPDFDIGAGRLTAEAAHVKEEDGIAFAVIHATVGARVLDLGGIPALSNELRLELLGELLHS